MKKFRAMSSSDDGWDLRVVTLNCWGLQGPLSKDRKVRIQKLAQELAKGKYDIIALQEIWCSDDFEQIKACIQDVIKYSHYFHSGFIGSGVCVYSRFPIKSALMHRYSLNGFAHHIHRGDWFGGKVVGLAELAVTLHSRTIKLHLYTTHIHAEYDRVNDLYLPHRVVQSFEMSQFIKHTSAGADLVIVTGDFNLEPVDLGFRMLLCNAKLQDAFEKAETRPADEHLGNTCDRPDNVYTHSSALENVPDGKRIDYILFRSMNGIECTVKSCGVCLNAVPDSPNLCYSDHAGVMAEFSLQFNGDDPKDNASISPTHEITELRSMIAEGVRQVEIGEKRVNSDYKLFLGSSVILLFVFVLTIDIELTYPAVAMPAIFCRFILTIVVGFCFWYGVIGLQLEGKALKAAKLGMALLQDSATEHSAEL